MKYEVDVYVLQGLVKVGVDAKGQEEAERKAVKEVETAEAGFHGNYPQPDKKYLAIAVKNLDVKED